MLSQCITCSLKFTLFIPDSHICSFNSSSYSTSHITAGREAIPAEKDQTCCQSLSSPRVISDHHGVTLINCALLMRQTQGRNAEVQSVHRINRWAQLYSTIYFQSQSNPHLFSSPGSPFWSSAVPPSPPIPLPPPCPAAGFLIPSLDRSKFCHQAQRLGNHNHSRQLVRGTGRRHGLLFPFPHPATTKGRQHQLMSRFSLLYTDL